MCKTCDAVVVPVLWTCEAPRNCRPITDNPWTDMVVKDDLPLPRRRQESNVLCPLDPPESVLTAIKVSSITVAGNPFNGLPHNNYRWMFYRTYPFDDEESLTSLQMFSQERDMHIIGMRKRAGGSRLIAASVKVGMAVVVQYKKVSATFKRPGVPAWLRSTTQLRLVCAACSVTDSHELRQSAYFCDGWWSIFCLAPVQVVLAVTIILLTGPYCRSSPGVGQSHFKRAVCRRNVRKLVIL